MSKKIKISIIVSIVFVALLAIPVYVLAGTTRSDISENYKWAVEEAGGEKIDCVWVSLDNIETVPEGIKQYGEKEWYKYKKSQSNEGNSYTISYEKPEEGTYQGNCLKGHLYIIQKGDIILKNGSEYNKQANDKELFKLNPEIKTEAKPILAYSCNPDNVVEVNGKDDTIRVKGAGKTVITVKVSEEQKDFFEIAPVEAKVTVEKASIPCAHKKYSKFIGTGSFLLDMAGKDGISYQTDNKKVAKVNSKGEVSIVGYDKKRGSSKATITVSASKDNPYYKGTISIVVTVKALAKPKLKVKQLGHLKTKYSWGKVEGAKTYNLYYKSGKKYKILPGYKNMNQTRVTVRAKKKGKTYMIVEACTKVNGTVYSTKSKAVLTKVK